MKSLLTVRVFSAAIAAYCALFVAGVAVAEEGTGFCSLFDGKTLRGWEGKTSLKTEDTAMVAWISG